MVRSIKIGPFRLQPFKRAGAQTGQWQIDLPAKHSPTRKRHRMLEPSRRAAEGVARRLFQEVKLGANITRFGSPDALTLREICKLWGVFQTQRVELSKKKTASLEVDLRRLKRVTEFMGDDRIDAITDHRLAEYQVHRTRQKRRAATTNGELRVLKAVLNWSRKEKYIVTVPTAEPLKETHKEPVILSEAEAAALIAHTSKDRQLLVRFLLQTGCRVGEATNLTWKDVDEVNGTVVIRSKDGWTPKTAHSGRVVHLPLGLQRELRRAPKTGLFVFPGRVEGQHIQNFRTSLNQAAKAAGIKRDDEVVRLSPHMLRKTYATLQAQRGVDRSILQAQLGHARGSRVTDRYYVFADEAAKRAAVLELPDVEQNLNAAAINLAKVGNNGRNS